MANSEEKVSFNTEDETELVPEATPSPPRSDDEQWQAAVRVGRAIEGRKQIRHESNSRKIRLERSKAHRSAPYNAARRLKTAHTTQFLNAAMVNNTELLQDMINKGFDPDTREPTFFRSALHIACSRGFTDSVRLLLENGASPNIRDLNENTPLHLASCTENIAIIDLLLKYDTNVTLKDSNGLLALEIAIGKLRLSDRIISKMQTLTKSDIHAHRNNVVKVCEMIFGEFKQQVRSGRLLYVDPSQAAHMRQRQLEEMLDEFNEQLGKIKERKIDYDSIVNQVENLNIKTEIDSDVNTLLGTLQKLSL